MTLVPAKLVPGSLVTKPDGAGVTRDAATRIAAGLRAALKARGRASVALSGGNTPRDAYATLASEPGHRLDARSHVFWVDERAVGPTDDRSNYRWAKATLLDGARAFRARAPDAVGRAPTWRRRRRRTRRPSATRRPTATPTFDLTCSSASATTGTRRRSSRATRRST